MAGKKKKTGQAIKQLGSAARSVRTALAERLLSHGFYAGQDQIMIALGQRETMTPGELAGELGVRPPTVTKTINRLSEQGFVDRRTSTADARQSEVFLTEKGRNALDDIATSIEATEELALDGMGKKDRRQLRKLLAQVEANLAGEKD